MVWKSAVVLMGLLLAAASAQAQSDNEVYTGRELTLDAGTIRLDLAPPDRALRNFGQGFNITKFDGVDDHNLDLNVGVGFGLVDNVEIGALVAPLALSPSERETYGDPEIYARVQLTQGQAQIGGQLSVSIPVLDDSDVILTPAIPIKLQLGDQAHLNTGVALPIEFQDDDVVVRLNVPVELAVNVTPEFFIGANSALLTDVTPDGFDAGVIPVGAFTGYSFALGNNSVLDVQAGFSFINLIGFGPNSVRPDTVDENSYQITVGATLYADVAR